MHPILTKTKINLIILSALAVMCLNERLQLVRAIIIIIASMYFLYTYPQMKVIYGDIRTKKLTDTGCAWLKRCLLQLVCNKLLDSLLKQYIRVKICRH